jgi:tetratricopeptide (TPR) repeat protein
MRRPNQRRAKAPPIFPPAPSWPRDETALLTETDTPLALLLWQRARDVRLWAMVSHESRAGLFVGGETVESALEAADGLVDGLSAPLRALAALARYPEFVTARDVCAACLAVSEWAGSSHMPETALHFAEAASLADPDSAQAAAAAGTACAHQAADQRAEVWFQRAIRIARRTSDWEWHARGYIRLGLLFYELGDLNRARRAYERAHASAKWSGHYAYAAKAHHDLLLVECATGTYESGERHARRALELYPAQFPRLPYLTHDFAYLLTCHGAFADALEVLDAVLPFLTRPWERVAIMGTISKAAAGVGDHHRHTQAVADLLLLASVADTHAAAALVLAAEGAQLLQERERAERLATYGLQVARRRREREPQRRARRVLDGADISAAVSPPARERVAATKSLFLARLRKLSASAAETVTHTDFAQFTMSGRL